MQIDQPIQSARLQLRNLTSEDAESSYLSWLHDPQINQYLEIRHNLPDLEGLIEYVNQMNASPDDLLLGICTKSGLHIGNIKLGPIDVDNQRGAIGILIGARDWWGKGIATEAIRAMTDFAFGNLSLHRVEAGCYASNMGSARAFEKAGWSIEGRRTHRRHVDHGWEDEILLGCVSST